MDIYCDYNLHPALANEKDDFTGFIRSLKTDFINLSMKPSYTEREKDLLKESGYIYSVRDPAFVANNMHLFDGSPQKNRVSQLESILFFDNNDLVMPLLEQLIRIQLKKPPQLVWRKNLDEIFNNLTFCMTKKTSEVRTDFKDWCGWFAKWYIFAMSNDCSLTADIKQIFSQARFEYVKKLRDIAVFSLNDAAIGNTFNYLKLFIDLAYNLGGIGIPFSQNFIPMLDGGYCAGITYAYLTSDMDFILGESQKFYSVCQNRFRAPTTWEQLTLNSLLYFLLDKHSKLGINQCLFYRIIFCERVVGVGLTGDGHTFGIKMLNIKGVKIVQLFDCNIGMFTFFSGFSEFKTWLTLWINKLCINWLDVKFQVHDLSMIVNKNLSIQINVGVGKQKYSCEKLKPHKPNAQSENLTSTVNKLIYSSTNLAGYFMDNNLRNKVLEGTEFSRQFWDRALSGSRI
jgi:hypothetical protein